MSKNIIFTCFCPGCITFLINYKTSNAFLALARNILIKTFIYYNKYNYVFRKIK